MAAKYQKVCVCFVGGKRWESFLLAVGLCLPLRHCLLFTTTDVLDEEKFNVELIVQCIRVSEMPQTHHHALLLLGTVAGIFPVSVNDFRRRVFSVFHGHARCSLVWIQWAWGFSALPLNR